MKAAFARKEAWRVLLALVILSLLGDSARGGDCVIWVKRTDVGSYGQRMNHAMAYDSHRGVTVFFGGEIGNGDDTQYFDDTQEYDGKQWRRIQTPVKPRGRSLHAMVYDPVRSNIVMFGGTYSYRSELTGNIIQSSLADVWIYSNDGTTAGWREIDLVSSPFYRAGAGMVWDSSNNVAILHGGTDEPANEFRSASERSWAWNGSSWRRLADGPELWGFGMAFDAARATTVIVGGFSKSAEENPSDRFWERGPDGVWMDRGVGPPRRGNPAMAYDERRRRVIVVGGVGDSVETGETGYEYLHGSGWVRIPSLPSGQGRAGARMVYDSKRSVMVLTGGAGGGAENAGSGGRYSDTWELWPSLFIGGQPLDNTNEVCTTATFSAGVQGNPPFQFTWLRDGVPLAADERHAGADTSELKIFSVRHSDAGKYQLVVRDNCDPPNVVTSRVATLTTKPESEWVFRTTNGPAPRHAHGMVYDSARRVTVLFGGRTNVSFVQTLNDLWEWDGARWTERVPNSVSNGWTFAPATGWRLAHTNVPVRRAHFAMAYDSRRGRTVIFGGWATAPDNSTLFLRDLWEWDGANWYFRGTNGPVPRHAGSMAYDERRGVTVLFGGNSFPEPGEQPDSHFVWEWDGDRWRTNSPANLPRGSSGNQPRMTYDSYRGVVVFGPSFESYSFWSFWDWDGTTWVDPSPNPNSPNSVAAALNGTTLGGFAFDSNRRRSIWFGGINIRTDHKTAAFDGKDWTFLTNSTPPPARLETAIAYDSDRRVMVMFGGNRDNSDRGSTNDTGELAAVDAPVINEHPASQIRLPNAGETATFRVSATGHGFIAYQWYFQNNLIVGAQSDTLTIPNVAAKDAGEYYVRVGSQCGSVTSRVAILSLERKLQIYRPSATTILFWSPVTNDTDVFLESADDVTGPWTIVPNPPNPFSISLVGPAKFYRYRKQE